VRASCSGRACRNEITTPAGKKAPQPKPGGFLIVVRSRASALSLLAGFAFAALTALLAALLAGFLLLLAGLAGLVLAALLAAAALTTLLAALLTALIWVLVRHWELLLFAGQSRTALTSRQWFWFPPRGLR
jgi:hypothetical protein